MPPFQSPLFLNRIMCAYRRLPRSSRTTQPAAAAATNNTTPTTTTAAATTTPTNNIQFIASNSERDASTDEHNSYPPPPKHIPFPDVPNNSDFVNEFLIFVYTLLAAAMQFLHLYRTVWWLPESYTNQTMNFYLIDRHLAIFIFTLLSRRIVYFIFLKIIDVICPQSYHSSAKNILRFAFFNAVLIILGGCCFKIFQKQSYIVIYLCYPIIVYIITFGLEIEPFLRATFEFGTAYLNGAPLHCCSTNPSLIRNEIDMLKADFNNRFKQVLFTAVLNAYYAGFIPCCFAQSFVFYDIYWATQHLGFMIVGGLTMCTIFSFPANYCDVLHRASLHLGQWIRVENRTHAPPALLWSKLVVWPSGSYVKHGGETFKASGLVTTAVPANMIHYRFYAFFQNPSHFYCAISAIQIVLVVVQLIVLIFADEWHNIISLSFLLLANYHILFKSIREYVVTQKIYSAESSIYDKFSGSSTTN